MTRLAVIASRGSLNSLVQVATLVMAAAASGIAVSVLFRDEAVLAASRTGDAPGLSEAYRGCEAEVGKRLAEHGLDDVWRLFAEARELGEVRLYACSSSMAICGAAAADLREAIDVRGLTAFLLEDVAAADRVLTF